MIFSPRFAKLKWCISFDINEELLYLVGINNGSLNKIGEGGKLIHGWGILIVKHRSVLCVKTLGLGTGVKNDVIVHTGESTPLWCSRLSCRVCPMKKSLQGCFFFCKYIFITRERNI